MRQFLTLLAVSLLSLPVLAQEHVARFELTEQFVHNWSDSPVMDVDVKLLCAAGVHKAADDCEIHVGAEFLDDSFTDFPNLVIEPPNLCHFPGNWKANINKVGGKTCSATGFLRAWPEHLSGGVGCSNPDHFLELHPALKLECGTTKFDFTSKLKAFADLGFKAPAKVNEMIDAQFFVCRGCSATPGMLSFDFCTGDPCTSHSVSNFARMKAEIIRSTIKTAIGQGENQVATAIARIRPKGSTSPRLRPLKLYAIKGTTFYDALVADAGKTGDHLEVELIGIFTLDPFSVKRVVDEEGFADGDFVPVPHPVSLIVFGTF